MRDNGKRWLRSAAAVGLIIVPLISGCSSASELVATPTPTNTGLVEVGPTEAPGRCEGLSGGIEMQILVGPAEAVGLEPVAVGTIPFTVSPQGGGYSVQGSGSILYEAVLEQKWGTYSVSLNLDASISGECTGDEDSAMLYLTLTASGEQMVEVRAEGFQGDYPWSGTHQFDLSFPAEEGASAEGEGWVFILHLD